MINRMNRTIRLWICLIAICAAGFGLTVHADTGKVSDNAGLMSESEIQSIELKISQLETKTGWEIFVVTIDDAGSSTTMEYNENWLNDHLTGDDGVSYIIDMDNREYYISTTGETIRYLTNDRIDIILDAGADYIGSGDYAGVFEAMLSKTEAYYRAGIPEDQYNYDSDTGEVSYYEKPKTIEWYEILIALALAAGAFGITFGAVVGKYRLKFGTYKYDFRANSSKKMKNQEDRFVNELVTHRHIPKNTDTSSGGGGSRSTTHTGSGGRSYGGGGKKF